MPSGRAGEAWRARRILPAMADLNGARPGRMTREEGLAALEELWGPTEDTPEQKLADAWARRALGLAPEADDERLLADVDAQIYAKYGRHVHRRRAS